MIEKRFSVGAKQLFSQSHDAKKIKEEQVYFVHNFLKAS
jgi:hypothetical protein